jgi:hypothetical protein
VNGGGIELPAGESYFPAMPMTVDQVVTEARLWPVERVAELVDGLAADMPESAAWKDETRRRIAEVQGGQVEGIPGEVVAARVRELVGR